MYKRYLEYLCFALLIVFIGCSTYSREVSLPEPRPLGREFATFQPPHKPLVESSASSQFEEPTGAITLSQVLSLALMKNPELKSFSWDLRVKEARTLQAGLLPNPEIDIELENMGGSGSFQGSDDMETTLQFSQLVELGGKRYKRRRLAALDLNLTGWDYETKRLDIFTRVTSSFIDLISAQEQLALTEELVRLAEEVLNTVSERVKAGKVSPVEESRARIALSTSQIEWERAKQRLEVARRELAATWGSTSPTFKNGKGIFDDIKSIPSFEELFKDISQNPDIARWETDAEKHQAAVEMEDVMSIPDLTLSGGLRRFNETEDHAFVIGLSIPIPIFDRNQGGILEARYRLFKAEEEKKRAYIHVKTKLIERYQALSTTFTETTLLKEEVLPGAQSAFEAIREGYRQGKFDYLEVLDAQRTLFEVRFQYIETLTTYHKTMANIERLIGGEIGSVRSAMRRK